MAKHEEIFGRASKMEAGDELSDNVDGRLSGKASKSIREMNEQDPSLSAIDIREAMSKITSALKNVAELAQKMSNAEYYAASETSAKENTEERFYSSVLVESQHEPTNTMRGRPGTSQFTNSSFYQIHVADMTYKSALENSRCRGSEEGFFLDAKRTCYLHLKNFPIR